MLIKEYACNITGQRDH